MKTDPYNLIHPGSDQVAMSDLSAIVNDLEKEEASDSDISINALSEETDTHQGAEIKMLSTRASSLASSVPSTPSTTPYDGLSDRSSPSVIAPSSPLNNSTFAPEEDVEGPVDNGEASEKWSGKDTDNLDDYHHRPVKKRKLAPTIDYDFRAGPSGVSRGAKLQKASREAIDAGRYDVAKTEKWKSNIHEIDPAALSHDDDPARLRAVHCSSCGSDIRVKSAYDTSRFLDHHLNCRAKAKRTTKTKHQKGKAAAFNTRTIDFMFGRANTNKLSASSSTSTSILAKRKREPLEEQISCPGIIDADFDPEELGKDEDYLVITSYLGRTLQSGGGSQSRTVIAMNLYKKPFRLLSQKDKDNVDDYQFHHRRWVNDHLKYRVLAKACTGMSVGYRDGRPRPCSSCSSIRDLHEFRTALRKEGANKKTMKFINKLYYPELLADRFANIKGLLTLFKAAVCFYTQF